MPGELLIAAGPGEWRAAWVANEEPVELYVERGDTRPPGSVHLGRVVRIVAGLDAALIDIGDERPGFLPLREAGAAKPEEGARLLVQVKREAWQDKAPRLTGMIATPDLPALAERAAHLEPAAQLFPLPGFAQALALRLPETPTRIIADDAAIVTELRAAFTGVEIAHHSAADWPFDVDTAFDAALAPSLALRGGGTVHFSENRAATLIDIDTGTPEGGGSARAVLAANRAAAAAIARQLRLRNIGGAVVIDFVGLDRRDHREVLSKTLEAALAGDPAKPQLVGWTRLGHMELTRPRRGRSLTDAMLHPPGAAKSARTLAHEALRLLLREARANPAASWRLAVGPNVAAVLRGPAAPALRALETRLGRHIAIREDAGRGGFDIAPL